MRRPSVFLGVDPGFSITGFAVIKVMAGQAHLLECDYLKLNPKEHLATRTGMFYTFFEHLIRRHAVTHVTLETSFLGKNPQTFLKLGYLRGILYLLAHQNKMTITEVAPREVKRTITGYGGASKEQVARVLMALYPNLTTMKTTAKNDVTDALAICLCGMRAGSSEIRA